MATKYFCDRCGKDVTMERMHIFTVRIHAGDYDRRYDYCDECLDAWRSFHNRIELEMKGSEEII